MQDEVILNRFKRLMHSGAGSEAGGRMALTGRVRSKTLQKARELAESIIEDEVRNLTITDAVRDLMLEE